MGNAEIRIRLAGPEDAEAIASILHESFIEYAALYTPEGFSATTPAAKQIHQRMAEGPVWVALSDDQIAGTVSAVLKRESLYVRGMGVLPTARGQRIGELLLENIEIFARDHQLRRLFLSTTPFLTRAIRLYERSGFKRTSEGPADLFGTPLFTMEKLLTK